MVFFMLLLTLSAKGQSGPNEGKLNPLLSFDEVPVKIFINGYGSFDTDVIITENQSVYLNLYDLFTKLGIRCVEGNSGNNLDGFIENESKLYKVDFKERTITVDKQTIRSVNGILKELEVIYVESSVINEAFGLSMIFNYRSLSIKLESNFELPVLKQMRLDKMRKNISKLQKIEVVADTIIARKYNLFRFGMVDWSFSSYQIQDEKVNNRIGLGIGTELLYGEANVSVFLDDNYKFDKRQLVYSWRWVDNNKKFIKQAQLGNIRSESISFLNAPVVGATITNSPSTIRKATGYYTITEHTEPNWTVELYINDVLVDYTKADASGLYVFKVPNVYGFTTLKFKFYGPLGEERTEERTTNTAYTFMPAKKLEYIISAGVLQDGKQSQFGKSALNYGVNKFITVGGGVEYLSSISDRPFIPFAKVAVQPFGKMAISLEYAHDVKISGLLNYYFGQSAFLEIDYEKFKEGQRATLLSVDQNLKIRALAPFKIKNVSGYGKVGFQQFIYDSFIYNQFSAEFSGYYKNFNANVSLLSNWEGTKTAYATSIFSLSYRMGNGVVFRPSAEYNLSNNSFIRERIELEKRVGKMYFSGSYERFVTAQTNNFIFSFKYDSPFARVGLTASHINNKLMSSQTTQGNLAFGADNYVKAGNNSAISKGGLLFYPFLDLNQNGILDKGEKMVLLSGVRVAGGTAVISKKDSIVRVSDLNAFVNYNVDFSNDDLESISWRFKHNTYQILVDPNQYKKVFVPIISVGELNGMVYINKENASKGLGRVTVQIYDAQGKKVAETLSESDGYFSYLGLKPGKYSVLVDEEQLKKLEYQSTPKAQEAFIMITEYGTIVDGLDFNLKAIEPAVP
jgi:hypothetical protein